MSILGKFVQKDEEKVVQKSAAENKSATAVLNRPARTVLKRPIITEKGSLLMARNQYVFKVDSGANKIQVAAAIKEMYGVKPLRVRIMNTSDKVRVRGRIYGRVLGWKKAIVTLPAGSSISVNEGGA